MQSRIDGIHERGAEVVAVSVDAPEESAKLARALGLTFPLLSDPDLATIDAYGVRHDVDEGLSIARPAVFVLDGEGRIRWRHFTDNWRVRVRPQEVLAALDGDSPHSGGSAAATE